jgi:periplasmic protein TonB
MELPLTRMARFLAPLLLAGVFAGASHAQMPQPDPTAYDTPPLLTQQNSPQSTHIEIEQSTAEADRANEANMVMMLITVDRHGLPNHVHAVRSTGKGLSEKAYMAVRQNRFKPALKDGEPVNATIYVKVTFDPAVNSAP